MDCVTQCPDTAILGKVLAESDLETKLAEIENEDDRAMFEAQWSKTRKYYDGPIKKGKEGGRFAILIDPSKCKGCAECVTVCDDEALKMIISLGVVVPTWHGEQIGDLPQVMSEEPEK